MPDVELVSTITEIEKESELILDNTPETEKKVVTDLQDTEADSSKVMISVEYTIEDQKLESGKTFEDIIVPEYAIAEDGNEVTGNVEWLDPDSKMILDPQMELSGIDGESMVWEWNFVPEEDGYESVEGTVELTICTAGHGVTNSIMDRITESGSENKNTSSFGSSTGATNIKEFTSILDTLQWMGSAMTGVGSIGNSNDKGDYRTDSGNLTIVHGVVQHEETEVQTEKPEESQINGCGTETEKVTEKETEEAMPVSVKNDRNITQLPAKKEKIKRRWNLSMVRRTGFLFLMIFQRMSGK